MCRQRPVCDPWLVSTWVVTWTGNNWWILTKILTESWKSVNKIPGCVDRRLLRTCLRTSGRSVNYIIAIAWSPSHLAALAGVDSVVVARGTVSADATLQVEHGGGGRKLLLACHQPINYWGWAGGGRQGVCNTRGSASWKGCCPTGARYQPIKGKILNQEESST